MQAPKDKIQILVVEDNPGDVHLIRIFLRESGIKHTMLHAPTFLDALEVLDKEDVDLIFLDLTLPDTHGFKTLAAMTEKHPNLPVIVLAGVSDETYGPQLLKAGAQDYLVKGMFNASLLGRCIRYSLQNHAAKCKIEEYAKQLAVNEKRYLESQKMAKLGNWDLDLVTNKMAWSEEVHHIFEFPPSSYALALNNYLDYVHPDDRAMFEDAIAEASKDGKLHKVEYRIVVGGKQLKYLVNQIKLFYDNINGRLFLAGVVQDVTEQKQSELLLQEKSVTDNVLKMKGDLLANLGFNVRTPLNSIVSFIHLLGLTKPSPQQEEYLHSLEQSADDLSDALGKLLNFTTLSADNIQVAQTPFKMGELIKNLIAIIQIRANSQGKTLVTEVEFEKPDMVMGDADKLFQALYNLLENALSRIPKEGKITFKIKGYAPKEQSVRIAFSIKDNGPTLSQDEIEMMLEGKTAKHNKNQVPDAHAYSILVAKKLFESLKADFALESKSSGGLSAQVKMTFQQAKDIPSSSTERLPAKSLRILLAEDHFLNQIATKRVLLTWQDGVEVEIAENGLIALQKFNEQHFDVILMDLQMPEMGGIEATEAIRKTSQIPIIALTASSSPQEEEKCMAAGFSQYLSKPFKPQDLFNKIVSVVK